MLRYLWKAFNVRPFGMPVPPLWFAVIASGLVGYFLAAPLAMIGLGATAMFTGILASSRRFRTTVEGVVQALDHHGRGSLAVGVPRPATIERPAPAVGTRHTEVLGPGLEGRRQE